MTDKPYPKPPDLQEWVERYGGYHLIDWQAWDQAIAAWHVARRIHTAGTVNNNTDAPRKRATKR